MRFDRPSIWLHKTRPLFSIWIGLSNFPGFEMFLLIWDDPVLFVLFLYTIRVHCLWSVLDFFSFILFLYTGLRLHFNLFMGQVFFDWLFLSGSVLCLAAYCACQHPWSFKFQLVCHLLWRYIGSELCMNRLFHYWTDFLLMKLSILVFNLAVRLFLINFTVHLNPPGLWLWLSL